MTINNKEIIVEYLEWSPLSLVIREGCRIYSFSKFLSNLDENRSFKVLDVGCGDGHWWQHLKKIRSLSVYGIDIKQSEIDLAKKEIDARCVDITDELKVMSYEKEFDIAVGNCSLEHVPQIDKALKNINSLLKKDGLFILYVPTPYWALKGSSIAILDRISPRLSMSFSGLLNGFFQHWHLYHHTVWGHILNNNGFYVEDVKGIGTKKLDFYFRLFLPASFVAFVVKLVTGKYLNYWIRLVNPKSLRRVLAKKINQEMNLCIGPPDKEDSFEYMIVARKK